MHDHSKFTFTIPANSFKWCEITCMVVPDVIFDVSKYCQHYRIWEVNLSMVFTAYNDTKSYDHKTYYFCCIAERWLLGDLLGQHFALIHHPLLDKIKLKILEIYPELIGSANPGNDPDPNSPSTPFFQANSQSVPRKKSTTREKSQGSEK